MAYAFAPIRVFSDELKSLAVMFTGLAVFAFMLKCSLCFLFKKALPIAASGRYATFAPRCFIVLLFTFGPTIHLELIFVYVVR